ncbi:MAG: thioredoxin family protein [Phycisphaerales bacterium]|nr:thioredoxin family protein [Phycisphaerales bacterium]
MRRLVIAAAAFLGLLVVLAPSGAAQFEQGLGKGKGGGMDQFLPPIEAPAVVGPGDAGEVVTIAPLRQEIHGAPGDGVVVLVSMEFQDGWHAWPSAEQDVLPGDWDFAVRTAVELQDVDGVVDRIGPIQWPEPHDNLVPDISGGSKPVSAKTYSGVAPIFVPLVLRADASAGEYSLKVTVSFQACDESMCMPPDDQTVDVTVLVSQEPGVPAAHTGFDASVFDRMRADSTLGTRPGEQVEQHDAPTSSVAGTPTGSRTFFGIPVTGGIVVLALLAAIGGLILNLTPCVLPVIPIKVMTISHHAGSPGKSLYLGLWMAAGVIAFWVGIGLPAALFVEFADPSVIFGIWWVTGLIGVLIGAMGVGIMGMFQINLPQKVYAINPKADSAFGSFMFGVMTGVLGLPCFGFVAGALLAGAATLPTATILAIFTFIGVGMASPYLVLSAKPSWVQKIPRTGPASELVKQVMGLLMIAAAAYFLGSATIAYVSERPKLATSLPWWGKVTHWWIVAFFAALSGLWLIFKTFAITKKPMRRLGFSVVGLIIGGVAIAWAADTTATARHSIWVAYDEATLQAALDKDKVVVLDFTAEWCLNCKALKATVLHREPVHDELRKGDVLAMVVDLTSRKAPGWEKLRALGQTGIPLLVVYGPGLDREHPWQANAYTPGQVMEALGKARGRASGAQIAHRD